MFDHNYNYDNTWDPTTEYVSSYMKVYYKFIVVRSYVTGFTDSHIVQEDGDISLHDV